MISKYYFLLIIIPTSLANLIATKPRKFVHPIEEEFNRPSEPAIGPKGMPYNKTTDCETFGKYARFNPHSITGIKWFVFYYWSNPQKTTIYKYWIPSKKDMKLIHFALDDRLPKHFNWSATLVLRRELISNKTKLLEERGDRGEYYEYSIYRGIPKGTITDYRKVRIKQTGDGKYLGVMDCRTHMAKVMSHFDAIPRQKDLKHEAMKLGIVGRKGRSYLYQGHEWMPVPEIDEKEFWYYNQALAKLK